MQLKGFCAREGRTERLKYNYGVSHAEPLQCKDQWSISVTGRTLFFYHKVCQAVSSLFTESEPNADVNLNFPSAKGEGKRMTLCSKHRTGIYLFLVLPQSPCATLGQVINLLMPQPLHL